MRKILATILLAMWASVGFALTGTWNNAVNGDWYTAANWTNNYIPNGDDTAYFTNSATYQVTFSNAGATNASCFFGGKASEGGGNVTWQMLGNTYNATSQFNVSYLSGHSNYVSLYSGGLSASYFRVANASTGSLYMSNMTMNVTNLYVATTNGIGYFFAEDSTLRVAFNLVPFNSSVVGSTLRWDRCSFSIPRESDIVPTDNGKGTWICNNSSNAFGGTVFLVLNASGAKVDAIFNDCTNIIGGTGNLKLDNNNANNTVTYTQTGGVLSVAGITYIPYAATSSVFTLNAVTGAFTGEIDVGLSSGARGIVNMINCTNTYTGRWYSSDAAGTRSTVTIDGGVHAFNGGYTVGAGGVATDLINNATITMGAASYVASVANSVGNLISSNSSIAGTTFDIGFARPSIGSMTMIGGSNRYSGAVRIGVAGTGSSGISTGTLLCINATNIFQSSLTFGDSASSYASVVCTGGVMSLSGNALLPNNGTSVTYFTAITGLWATLTVASGGSGLLVMADCTNNYTGSLYGSSQNGGKSTIIIKDGYDNIGSDLRCGDNAGAQCTFIRTGGTMRVFNNSYFPNVGKCTAYMESVSNLFAVITRWAYGANSSGSVTMVNCTNVFGGAWSLANNSVTARLDLNMTNCQNLCSNIAYFPNAGTAYINMTSCSNNIASNMSVSVSALGAGGYCNIDMVNCTNIIGGAYLSAYASGSESLFDGGKLVANAGATLGRGGFATDVFQNITITLGNTLVYGSGSGSGGLTVWSNATVSGTLVDIASARGSRSVVTYTGGSSNNFTGRYRVGVGSGAAGVATGIVNMINAKLILGSTFFMENTIDVGEAVWNMYGTQSLVTIASTATFLTNATVNYYMKDGGVTPFQIAGAASIRGTNNVRLWDYIDFVTTNNIQLMKVTSWTQKYNTTNGGLFACSDNTTQLWAALDSQYKVDGTWTPGNAVTITPTNKGWLAMTQQTTNYAFNMYIYTNGATAITLAGIVSNLQNAGYGVTNLTTGTNDYLAFTSAPLQVFAVPAMAWDFTGIDTNIMLGSILGGVAPSAGRTIRRLDFPNMINELEMKNEVQ